jgi:hypothetical protein
VLPYNSISGGGLGSYKAAVMVALTGIVGISAGICLIAIATGLKEASFFKIWFWITIGSLCINIINNFSGVTVFQKIVMTLVNVLQAILFLHLATGMLHKISKKAAGIGIISTYIFIISIYLLVIFKVLPYDWITGQTLDNHQIVVIMSMVTILVTTIGIPIVAIASELKELSFFKVWFWLMFVFLCLNTLLNLASVTLFEKIIMGLITFIEAICYFRLATTKDK